MRRKVSVIILGIVVSTLQLSWVPLFSQTIEELDDAITALKANHQPNRDVAIQHLRHGVFGDIDLGHFQWGIQDDYALIRQFRNRSMEVMNPLISAAKNGDKETRRMAMWLLSTLGPNAYGAGTDLVTIVNNKSEDIATRATALRTLFFVTPESEPVLSPTLFPIDMLNFPDKTDPINNGFPVGIQFLAPLSESTILGSGHMRSEVPFLISQCKSDDPRIRSLALLFLFRFANEARDYLPQLQDLFDEVGPEMRLAVSLVIVRTDPQESVIAKLRSGLSVAEQPRFEIEVLEFQTEIERLIKDLESTLSDHDTDIENWYIRALRHGTGPVRRNNIWLLSKINNLPEKIRLELRKAQEGELSKPGGRPHLIDSRSIRCPNSIPTCRPCYCCDSYQYHQSSLLHSVKDVRIELSRSQRRTVKRVGQRPNHVLSVARHLGGMSQVGLPRISRTRR